MQIQRRGLHPGLTQHHMNLPAMMGLMIEEVRHGDARRLHIVLAGIVHISERSIQKAWGHRSKERLNGRVLMLPRHAQRGKVIK